MGIEATDGERRPDSSLFNYYALTSLVLGPFFFFLLRRKKRSSWG